MRTAPDLQLVARLPRGRENPEHEKPPWAGRRADGALWFAILAVIGGHALGLGVVWQRGLHSDDYCNAWTVTDPPTGDWSPLRRQFGDLPRCLGALLATNATFLARDHEGWVRAGAALLQMVNVALVALLVRRLGMGRLATLATAWLATCPALAHEAYLWTSASLYLVCLVLWLALAHAFETLLFARRPAPPALLLPLVLVFALLFNEQSASAALWLPCLALAAALNRPTAARQVLWRGALGCAVIAGTGAAVFLAIFARSGLLGQRGGLVHSFEQLYANAAQMYAAFGHYRLAATDVASGPAFVAEALRYGWQTVRGSSGGLVLLGLTLAAIVLTALCWRRQIEERPRPRALAVLSASGLVSAVLTLLLPMVLVAQLYTGVRMLYIPLAIAAVAVAGLAALLAAAFRNNHVERFLVLCAGGVLLLNTTTTVGFAGAYARRHAQDERELAAVQAALPSEILPANAVLVPIRLPEELVLGYPRLSAYLLPAFDVLWAGEPLLRTAYRREDLSMRVRFFPAWGMRAGIGAKEDEIIFQGLPTPVVLAAPLIIDGDGLTMVSAIEVVRPDGVRRQYTFPIAERAARSGVPTTELTTTEGLPMWAPRTHDGR